jgi:hypothetical protein
LRGRLQYEDKQILKNGNTRRGRQVQKSQTRKREQHPTTITSGAGANRAYKRNENERVTTK